MSHPAISVENLSKVYRLGVKDETPDTIASAFTGALRSPLRNWRRLRRLSRFNAAEDSEDTLWALRDVSFEVKEGEVLGVIGRNGAGKSTLLKILSRITEPTSGRAVIRGRVSSLLEVGTGFHPELTGRENIYMNGTILGMRKREIDRKFDEIVDFSGVEKFLDTPIKRFSSGMNVRLAFAVAAHLEPEILIIDEVLAVGDVEFQKKCMGKMQDVARGGRTVLFVSHNMAAVDELCHETAWLSDGTLRFRAATNEVIREYLRHTSLSIGANYVSNQSSPKSVELLKGSIETIGGGCTGTVRFAEPFTIWTVWRHMQHKEHVCYSIRVTNERGILVFATNTIGQRSIEISSPGLYQVKCTIDPNVLAPGTYRVNVGAWIRGRECLCDIPECLQFDVSTIPYDRDNAFLAVGNPIIAAPVRWELIDGRCPNAETRESPTSTLSRSNTQ